MANATEMNERRAVGLAELADLGLSLARNLHGRAVAAADDKAAGDLALAFHRISRSVRQTYALEARLERERTSAAREEREEQARETLVRAHRKRAQVRNAVSRLIWTEREAEDEADDLFEAVESLLMDESADAEAFLEAPLEDCVERIRAGLGLPANDPPSPDGPPDVVIWKSSG